MWPQLVQVRHHMPILNQGSNAHFSVGDQMPIFQSVIKRPGIECLFFSRGSNDHIGRGIECLFLCWDRKSRDQMPILCRGSNAHYWVGDLKPRDRIPILGLGIKSPGIKCPGIKCPFWVRGSKARGSKVWGSNALGIKCPFLGWGSNALGIKRPGIKCPGIECPSHGCGIETPESKFWGSNAHHPLLVFHIFIKISHFVTKWFLIVLINEN